VQWQPGQCDACVAELKAKLWRIKKMQEELGWEWMLGEGEYVE
jgi:hypothetical protein